MNTANESSPNASQTESCPSPQSLRTCVSSYSPVQPQSTEDLQTWLAAAFPANPSAKQEERREPTTNEICGLPLSTPSAQYDRATSSWKMCLDFFGQVTLGESWETWPKAGMIVAGAFYPQPNWVRRISEIASGSWATPQARDFRTGGAHRWANPNRSRNLNDQVVFMQMWPTPTISGMVDGGANHNSPSVLERGHGLNLAGAVQKWSTPRQNIDRTVKVYPNKRRHADLVADVATVDSSATGGLLNPTWVEWLMGWCPGWTDLEPLGTDKFQSWRQLHGIS